MGDRNITKEERVFMEVSKQDDVKKSNKQWLRYGATSVLVALGMGAGAVPNVTANETTAGSQPGAFATSESDESVETPDTDDRDKDGDGRDDETGEPVAAESADESSAEVTQEPNNESEETPAETPQEEPVVAPETTETSQQESGASEADTSTPVAETPADTEITETPENVETPTNDVAVEPETSETDTVPETIVSTEPSAPSEVAETPTSEESELSSITSESSEASSSASSEKVTENSEAGDVSTNESETSQTDVESVSEASSDETESETETPEEDTSTAELGEGTDVTVMQEPVANPAAETATAEKVVTVSDPGTYAADEIIQVANAFDGNAPVEFKATDYGIDETVTVTYEDNRFLWINMSLNAKLNNVDMTALKAFAVRNRLNIAFTQEGERPKDATTGLTDTQQASLDLFNKEAFNLREETQVSNEAGTLLVYWPTRGDAYSDAFDTTDHSDVSHFADKIDMPWIVASASEMRMAAGQNPSPGDSVTDSPNLPAGIKGNTALLQAYMPIEAVIGTDNRTYMLMVARPGVTKDDTGKAVTPLQTMIAIQYSSSGTGTRTYITSTAESGYAGNVAGMTITNNYANGNWGYNITNAIAVGDGNGKTDGAPADTKTRTNWLRYSNTNSTAEVRYYVKQADGTFKEINGPIAGAPTSSDAHNNPLYGGSSPYYSDQFTFTTDSLPGYKLIDSMTQVSGKNVQISSPNAAGQMTITGQFSGTDYDKMNGINWYESAALYSALLNPNSPFDLATVQALFPDLNLTKIPKGATLYTIAKGSSTATWINWPVVDANGNIVTEQRASFISDGTMNRTNSSVLQLYTTQSVTAAQSSASAAAGNPVWPTDTSGYADSTVRKDVSLSTAVLSYYLSADGKTVKASSTAISGYTKITGNLYRDTSGKYTTSATDALGNPNQLAAVVPDYLDSDADGKIDSNFAFRTGGTDASAYATYGTRLSVPSGVSLYFEAIPQNATVDYQTATVDSSGKITLTTNKVPNKTQATLTAVTGDQIGVPVQGDTTTNNSWSAKANATAPAGYTYVGFTYNGGALQSVKKSDGTIAMPNEVNTVKYTSTAINGATESDDKIVLYYVAVQQTANVTFSYQTGSTGPAISSASTTGNSSATINATNGSAAKGNTTIVLDANGINVVAAIPKGYHVVSSAMTSGTGLTYSDTTKTITGAFDATANGSSGTDSTQQTINLVLAADSQTANVVVSTTSASTPTYKAGASVDKATGGSTTKITFATASDTTLKQAGYTYTVTGPDGVVYATLAAAMAATPNYDTTANGSSTTDATPQTFTVTYVADKQTANVVISSSSATTPKYAAGAKVDTVSGDSNTKITFATASDTALKQAGYSYTVTGPDGKTYATLALAQAAVPNFDATDNNGSATDGTQQNFTVNYTIDKQTANVTVSSTSDTTPKYAAGAKVDTATGG